MMRISLLKTVLRTITLAIATSMATLSFGQQTLIFDFQSMLIGDTIFTQVKVYDFEDILSMQFTMEWDEAEMEFISLQGFNLAGLDEGNFNQGISDQGYLTYSWFDPAVTGITAPDCSTLFTIKFVSLQGNISPIEINSDITGAFILDAEEAPVPWTITPSFCGALGIVSGKVFNDLDNDCSLDVGEEGFLYRKIKLESSTYTFYCSTDADGEYSITIPSGNYDVSLVTPNNSPWQSCTAPQTIQVDTNSTYIINYPLQALFDCPLMVVDISTPFLRRCFTTNYYAQYCNEGTAMAHDAYVEIEFDNFLNVQGSSIPWSSKNGNTYTFQLGDVAPGVCGTFSVQVETSCNAVLGQTHCTNAHIYPDDPCVPTLLWDGSDLDIAGACDGDSVRFDIINLGDDMTEAVEFIVIEDDMIYLTSNPVQLLSQQSVSMAVQANGSTWRVEIPEAPNNPFGRFATEAIEGCGTNGDGTFSLGFVNQFPMDDESPAIDEDCQENIGAYDPNDKIGYPKGFCQAHYIESGQDIEYKIRFQNTGTDTAFNIVVIDTLSNFLSPATVRPGSSSHPYEFDLLGAGVVKFSFPNIMLPDSNINEPASHGFVKFTVSQRPSLDMGAAIENHADIYFDFNDPIRTNTYRHTIGDEFVEMQGQSGDLSVSGTVETWFGEPVENAEMLMTNLCPVYTDLDGYFLFENIDTADYSLHGMKTSDATNDNITVLDVLKLRQHILGISVLNVFQQLAADLNRSGSVTTFDMLEYRRTILGIPSNQQPLHWLVFRENIDTNALFLPSYEPYKYNYMPLEENLDNQDFIAVQKGNILEESMVELSPINTQFSFEVENQQGGQIQVHVKANEFIKVNAFQFGLRWDGSILQYVTTEEGLLGNFTSEWQYSPAPGQLNLAFIQEGETTASPNDILFTLVFNVLGNVDQTTTLELDESNLSLQVVVDDCKLTSPSILPTDITIQEPNAVIDFGDIDLQVKVTPNPVRQGQSVQLEVATLNARSLHAQLYDLSGASVETAVLESPAGKSFHHLSKSLRKGIYFLKITSEEGVAMTAKVIVY